MPSLRVFQVRVEENLFLIAKMEVQEVQQVLEAYENELTGILSRFTQTRDGIHINRQDDPRFRQLVIELGDFLNDTLGKNSYSSMIENYFNEGISNFTCSPSYASVEQIKTVVSSIITRINRNPEILFQSKNQSEMSLSSGQSEYLESNRKELEPPQRVTVSWLIKHVPIKFWVTLLGIIVAAFILGIRASRISLVQEVLQDLGVK